MIVRVHPPGVNPPREMIPGNPPENLETTDCVSSTKTADSADQEGWGS